MKDPQSFPPPPEPAGAPAEDARIEQLLVSGLDHYFAGEFEPAINLWTRVLFLDRQHNRARAYIERARSAQAERHRQTEALVHQGLDAFDRGDVERARTLLSDAMAGGASHDLALGVLDRIDRLDVTGTRDPVPLPARRPAGRPAHPPIADVSGRPRPTWSRFWALTVAIVGVLGLASWWTWTTKGWSDLWPRSTVAAPAAAVPDTIGPLPVPSVSEAYLNRGQALFESGRLSDALAQLDRVGAADPLRATADEMRARIQRELLGLALTESSTTPPAVSPGRP
ncbi:MAG: hypothetical protein OEW19_03825 [Acidobacteriota bacterium]|nr:hypothetical protein [Acidobacteriota bacterium]